MVAGDLDFESTASVVDPNDGMLAEAEKSQFIFIGFFGTYRSPSLENTEMNQKYFDDMTKWLDKLHAICGVIYLLGDINVYTHRYSRLDESVIVPSDARKQSYEMFTSAIPMSYRHLFNGVTHRPYQSIDTHPTCAQLDYVMALYTYETDVPEGLKCVDLVTMSDHVALSLTVPLELPIELPVRMMSQYRYSNVNYELMDSILVQSAKELDFAELGIEECLRRLELEQKFVEESTGTRYKVFKPKSLDGLPCKISLLQNRALKAKGRGDFQSYAELANEIRESCSELAKERMKNASRHQCSANFYKWAASIAKPCKVKNGKNVMVDKSVIELTDEINANYL